jgi:hypothetical protein
MLWSLENMQFASILSSLVLSSGSNIMPKASLRQKMVFTPQSICIILTYNHHIGLHLALQI